MAIAACCGCVQAGDMQLTVHWVELSHERTTALLTDGLSGDALFQKVRELAKDGEARIVNTALLRGKSGERALAESTGEISYPAEYEPPDLPNSQEYEKKLQRRMEGWAKVFPFFPMFPAAWTGEFETFAVGEKLDVEFPVAGQAPTGSWQMECSTQGPDTVVAETVDMDGRSQPFRFPNFDRLSTHGASLSAHWSLAAVLTPKPADAKAGVAKKILVFARTDLLDD